MASTIWKGHLTFGLVSIPVKLVRAARAEKISFRQLHAATGTRVRQTYMPTEPLPDAADEDEDEPVSAPSASVRSAPQAAPRIAAVRGRIVEPEPAPPPRPEPPREIERSELVKGYEYSQDRFVTITREDLEKITAKTARESEILEFVRLNEVDPVYFETSYYVVPDRGGERAYALLLEALRRSGYAAVARLAMHNREHIVIARPGSTGLILHTMFYDSEIRRENEYRTDTADVSQRELDLALLLIENLAAPFDASKYRDTYREKLEALIQAKIAGEDTVEAPAPEPRPVANILEALQKSLATAAQRKPPATEQAEPAARRGPPAKHHRRVRS
jgi:DNA end-binding protein Ku